MLALQLIVILELVLETVQVVALTAPVEIAEQVVQIEVLEQTIQVVALEPAAPPVQAVLVAQTA